MTGQPDEAAGNEQCVQAILHDYLLALDEGQPVDRQEILRRHPELADELQALFADQDELADLARSARAGGGHERPPAWRSPVRSGYWRR